LAPNFRDVVGPLNFGTRIHAALEAYYADGLDLLETHSKLIETDRMWLLTEGRDLTKFEKEAELGRIMLEGYLEWLAETGADSDLEVISAEEKIAVPLFEGQVELRAKLDMRIRRLRDGVRLFVDHKSSINPSDYTRGAHMDEQFLTYHVLEACQKDREERCDGGMYNILKKVKRSVTARPPFYERLEVRHNARSLDSMWYRLHGEITEIMKLRAALDSGADHRQVAYPSPNKNCSWDCDFYAVCPMFDEDPAAAEQMIDQLYTEHDPYERYGTA